MWKLLGLIPYLNYAFNSLRVGLPPSACLPSCQRPSTVCPWKEVSLEDSETPVTTIKKTWPELAPLIWAEGESGQAAFGTTAQECWEC